MPAPSPRLRLAARLRCGVAIAALSLTALSASAHAATPNCSLYAAPNGSDANPGTLAQPLASAQKLVDTLAPGQTGCLRQGTYSQNELRFDHGGQPGAPITLSSYPGETATIAGGIVYTPSGSDHIVVENVHIDTAAAGASQVGIQIMSRDVSLIGDDITNENVRQTCIILGSTTGWGQAVDTVIEQSVIHQCGSTADGNQDHAIYFDSAVGTVVNRNVIWGTSAYPIHLYQDAQDSQITQNVIVDNGYGVIFAGSTEHTSNNNVVAHNVIADAHDGYDIESYFPGTVGQGNLLADNCLSGGEPQPITTVVRGFSTQGNVVADPKFVDPSHHNYTLSADSPCLSVLGGDSATDAGNPSLRTATTAVLRPTSHSATHTTTQAKTRRRKTSRPKVTRRHRRRPARHLRRAARRARRPAHR